MLFDPKTASSEELNIELATPSGSTFAPGDTIIGNVVRKSHIVTPHANLKLSLWGQTGTKIIQQYGDDHREYKAKWILFNARWDQLFRGPVHVPAETDRKEDYWTTPFSVDIPTRPSESWVKFHPQAESYLPLDSASVALQMLPGTFSSHQDGFYGSNHGFIEYYLEAVLTYSYGGSTVSRKATRPIVLCHTSIEPPLTFYEHQRYPKIFKVCSQRLTPGMEDARLSFGQKTQKFFRSSKVPTFSYTVDIVVPKKVQLDSPLPIPFTVRITSLPDESSESIRGTLQTIQIHSVKLSIKGITDIRAPGWSGLHSYFHTITKKYDSISLLDPSNSPVVLSIGGKSEKDGSSSSESVDVGSLFGLCLRPNGLQKGNPPRVRNMIRFIYPDFTSYLVKHANRLSWEVCLSVAGESEKVSASAPLKVLSEYSRLL